MDAEARLLRLRSGARPGSAWSQYAEAGFRPFEVLPLAGPVGAGIARR